MRIGILTLPLHTNYGGILQAYALNTILSRMGHDVVLIEHKRLSKTLPFYVMPVMWARRFFLRYVKGDKAYSIFGMGKSDKETIIKNKYTWKFADKHFKYCFHPYDLTALNEHDFDAIIVGSDQVWRREYILSQISRNVSDAFLGFAAKWQIKKIAYAASFGGDDIEFTNREIVKISKLLSKFDAVSVREKSAVGILKDVFAINASFVLDPTLLLQKEDYMHLIEDGANTDVGISCYILDRNKAKDDVVESLSAITGLRVSYTNKNLASGPVMPQPPLSDWLSSIAYADIVLTDSFHACVFSIIFHKKFIVIPNERRGIARIKSLLGGLGLESHILYDYSGLSRLIDVNDDWTVVDARLNELRGISNTYLTNTLKS